MQYIFFDVLPYNLLTTPCPKIVNAVKRTVHSFFKDWAESADTYYIGYMNNGALCRMYLVRKSNSNVKF